MTDQSEAITQICDRLLGYLNVQVQAQIEFDSESEIYKVNLVCDNPGVLIGHHGETLAAVQLVLSQHLKAQTGEWVNVTVNVNDYRERREEALHQMADSTVEQVIATGQAHSLPPLPANERRIVHMYLTKHSKVKTESAGEGRSRSVVISLNETAVD